MAVQPIAISPSLASVLDAAGNKSDVDFNYLLKTAMRESRLNPQAKSPSSSATGLFQFLDSTWLEVMKSEGPRLGYQKYAGAITRNGDGNYVIKDPKLRAKVLSLRENPQVSADMAAAFTKSNGEYLEARFGRMPSPGELYIAHFLGPQGAARMFEAGLRNPNQVAANLFPSQAQANHNIFYAGKHARTIKEVYEALVGQHRAPVTPVAGFAAQQAVSKRALAEVEPVRTLAQSAPASLGPDDMSFTALFSTDKKGSNGSPLQAPEAGQGAFFTQLYGQND